MEEVKSQIVVVDAQRVIGFGCGFGGAASRGAIF